MCEKDAGEIEQYVKEFAKEQFDRRYIALTGFTDMVYADKRKVEMEITGEISPAFTDQLLEQKVWHFHASAKADRICPTECIRRFRLAKKIGGGISESL